MSCEMEERSAANLGGGGEDSDDEDFDEGYDVEQLLLQVRGEELRHQHPVLQVTRSQKVLAGETLLLPKRCRDKKCISCQMNNCLEAKDAEACLFCQQEGKQALCIRQGKCQSWSEAQYQQLEEAREVLQALRESASLSQVLNIGAGCTNPDMAGHARQYQTRENTGSSSSKPTETAEKEETRAEKSPHPEEEDGKEVEIQIHQRNTGTRPKAPKVKLPGTANIRSLAARPFVQREDAEKKYCVRLDLNQLAYQFDPKEYKISARKGRMLVTALHQGEELQEGNTPTKSGLASQSYHQEFELPPHVDPATALCTITQDNVAVVEFEYTAPEPMLLPRDSPSVPRTAVAGEKEKERKETRMQLVEKDKAEKKLELLEEIALRKNIQEGEEAVRGQLEAQRQKYLEVMRMQEQLKANHHKLQLIQEGLEAGLQTTDRALGAQAISRDEIELTPAGAEDQDDEELNYYRGRWNRAKGEWIGIGMPRFPEHEEGRGVYWRDPPKEDSSFYSVSGSPETCTPVRAPLANPEEEDEKRGARRNLLTAATFNPDNVVKPWDRGGEMWATKTEDSRMGEAEKGLKTSKAKSREAPLQQYATLWGVQGTPRSHMEKVDPFQRYTTLRAVTEAPKDTNERKGELLDRSSPQTKTQNIPAAASTPVRSQKASVTRGEKVEEMAREREKRKEPDTEQGQLAQVLTLLTEKLMKTPTTNAEKASTLKLPTITLPRCKRDGSEITSARQWYTFKYNLYTAMATHNLDEKVLLMHYSTDTRLLSSSIQDTFQTSDTLQGALDAVDSRYPPVSSLHAELQKELLAFPPMDTNSEKAKIVRLSKVLTSLEDFLKFFKNEATLDISREKILVILHNLAGDTASKQELVKEVAEMDRKRASGQLYADSLKQFLLRQRLMYTDLNAALTIVGSHGGKHRSAAYKEKEIPEAIAKRKEMCPLCQGPHRAWACNKELQKIKDGARTLPSQICRACLEIRKTGHPPTCSIVRTRQNGMYYLFENRCSKCSIHVRICPCGNKAKKKIDPNQNPPPIKKSSAALRTTFLPQENDEEEESERGAELHMTLPLSSAAVAADDEMDRSVVFMTEKILILGQNNDTTCILVSYDSHGSTHHLAGESLNPNFNWSSPGHSKAVTMNTVTGEVLTQLTVYKLQLLTLTGRMTITALEGQWPDSQTEPQLEESLATFHGISLPNEDGEEEETLPRLILGCSEFLLHPKKIRTPDDIAAKHPKLAIVRSTLSGNLLACGELGGGTQ